MSVALHPEKEIIYPESDGQPMAENTKQFRWIVLIKENLETLFRDDPQVFVAGDLLWYPVEGEPEVRRAPDAMVVFGRPKGDRRSYRQWVEDNIVPQVVFEVLSPGNILREIFEQLTFYDDYGVEEYYIYNPDKNELTGLQRQGMRLQLIDPMDGWISPRLGIRFDLSGDELQIFAPHGTRFLSHQELQQRATDAEQRATDAEQRAAQLAARLQALGIDPDAPVE